MIVPTPWASPIVPGVPIRLERFTTNVSFGSSVVSPIDGTETTLDVTDFVSETSPGGGREVGLGDVAEPAPSPS